ncbi:MAG: 2-methylaconitate cis-trans isomerase PrpF family protein [Salinirussus sp.]
MTAQGTVDGRLVRGGTSRGLFVTPDALPVDLDDERMDHLALELFGSPDPIQVDGIGGSHSHTSKLMIVDISDRDGIDIDYTFGQVAIERPVVDWGGNCGNLTSAVGSVAMLEGLVEPTAPSTDLTLYNTNTDTVVEQSVPVREGEPAIAGDYHIDGVAGTGARIDSRFLDPAGGVLGSLFPTGNPVDTVTADGEEFEISLVDVTNPCVFVRAADLNIEGTELPDELSAEPGLLERFEAIRGAVCEKIGRVEQAAAAADESPTVPFIAAVGPPATFEQSTGGMVHGDDIDLTARIITTQTPHHAYAMTGAMCLGAAARLPGTIPNEVARSGGSRVTIGHPKGTISIEAEIDAAGPVVESVTVGRTMRPIADGTFYYRREGELANLE